MEQYNGKHLLYAWSQVARQGLHCQSLVGPAKTPMIFMGVTTMIGFMQQRDIHAVATFSSTAQSFACGQAGARRDLIRFRSDTSSAWLAEVGIILVLSCLPPCCTLHLLSDRQYLDTLSVHGRRLGFGTSHTRSSIVSAVLENIT